MFQVNNYRIVFKRRWHQLERHLPTCMEEHRPCKCDKILKLDGRYDTVCEIYVQNTTQVSSKPDGKVYFALPRFTDIARLHPNEKPDKVVGKKIALFRAMGLSYEEVVFYNAFGVETKRKILRCSNKTFNNKDARTAIWKAFFKWVASWSVGHAYLNGERSNI